MTFLDKIKTHQFWTSFRKVFVPFLILLVIFHLILNSASDIFSGNFSKVVEENFGGDLWISFFGFKLAFSFIYSLWMTNRNMR